MRDLLVWDAVIAWWGEVLKKDVLRKCKVNYLSSMAKMIERGNCNLETPIFNISQPLKEFIEGGTSEALKGIEEISEWAQGTKKYRRAVFSSFYKFVKKEKVKQTDISFPISSAHITEILSANEDKVKSQYLEMSDIMRFLEEIDRLNQRDFLICWMMWTFQCSIHEILDLTIDHIDFDKNSIQLESQLIIGLKPELKQCILKQSEGKAKEDLLFTTRKGSRIHAGQLVRNMKMASKQAKLPIVISPKILIANAKAYSGKAFKSMSKEEIQHLCKIHESIAKNCKNLFQQ